MDDIKLLTELRKKRQAYTRASQRAKRLGYSHGTHPTVLEAYSAYSELYCTALESGLLGPSNYRPAWR